MRDLHEIKKTYVRLFGQYLFVNGVYKTEPSRRDKKILAFFEEVLREQKIVEKITEINDTNYDLYLEALQDLHRFALLHNEPTTALEINKKINSYIKL